MTKIYSFLSTVLLIVIITSCQKEYSLDDANPGGAATGTAVFTFTGTPGNCSGATTNGIFKTGTPADLSNNISIILDVSTPGTYSIVSNSVNGVSFSATGTFTSGGLKTIVLQATGTPAAAGTFNFSLGANSCTFSITSIPATAPDDCKECIYIPICPGSKYEFTDSAFDPFTQVATISPRLSNYIATTDTTINGLPFKKLEGSDGTSSNFSYFNCTNNETTVVGYNVQSTTSGAVLVALKLIGLKANAPVGTSWSDTSNFASGNTFYRKSTLAAKGISRTLLGVTYNDVIKVTVDQSVLYVDPPLGLTKTGISDYYYAKGIGLIEVYTYAENPITNQNYIVYHSVLKSHLIP